MTILYTINWKKIGKRKGNFITLNITCLDERGKQLNVVKIYEEWLGVCTNDINLLIEDIKYYFPGIEIRHEKLDDRLYVKVLPYFRERLKTRNFNYEKHSFYKVYVDCDIEDLGIFFKCYNIAYFHKSDWLARLYIDFSIRDKTQNGFFYRWYEVDMKNNNLMDAFRMKTDINYPPRWKIAAFDIETVSFDNENRVPDGMDPADKIVMISIIKWQEDSHSQQNLIFKKEYILYLNPVSEEIKQHLNYVKNKQVKYLEYKSENQLLNDFHYLIKDCHVITGYNINKFDIPCIFARLLWLGQYNILNQYSSSKIGDYLIATFQEKIIIDAYNYFQIFSNYDLSSFKLDTVAKTKLTKNDDGEKGEEEGKLAIDSVGIHAWYKQQPTRELCLSNDSKYCYKILNPANVSSADRFGTFSQYLEYCLRDSELVFKLFRKEMILGFLTARANFGALSVVQALHFGNSRVLLEIFKTYGVVLGFYLNIDFFENQSDGSKYSSMYSSRNSTTYQGALNYCLKESYFEDVVVLDFMSMYPMALLNANLCYGTCDILTSQEYQDLPDKNDLTAIPYRTHSDKDFIDKEETFNSLSTTISKQDSGGGGGGGKLIYSFRYPSFDVEKDSFVIVINQKAKSFLPTLVEHFITARKIHQKLWKETKDVFHYNCQLCIKILINSMYGTMASKDSPLAYITIAMAIVTLSRYQLLGSYQFVEKMGYTVCYADTDSLMVHRWPVDNCKIVNDYLNLKHVDLKFEHRMKRILILSKKRYIFEINEGQLHIKGFQKKVNNLIKFMSNKIINAVMNLHGQRGDPSDGWILWRDTLCEAFFMCRDPKKYSITRKTKKLEDYVSAVCPAVKMLKKYPDKQGGYIDYAYSRADVSDKQSSFWIMDVKDCKYVNFDQLFMSQKKIFVTLINIGYWNLPNPEYRCNMVLNTMRWKSFLQAELKHYFESNKKIMMLVEQSVKYTFQINDCFSNNGKKRTIVVKRKINISKHVRMVTKTNLKNRYFKSKRKITMMVEKGVKYILKVNDCQSNNGINRSFVVRTKINNSKLKK